MCINWYLRVYNALSGWSPGLLRETQAVSSTLCLQCNECCLSPMVLFALPRGERLFILLQATVGAAPHCSHVPNSAPATGYLAVGIRQPRHHCAIVIMPPPTQTEHVTTHTSGQAAPWSAVGGTSPIESALARPTPCLCQLGTFSRALTPNRVRLPPGPSSYRVGDPVTAESARFGEASITLPA